MGSRSRASSHLRVLRPLARLDERLEVDAGELQTLACVGEARKFEEATVVAVRVIVVLQNSASSSCLVACNLGAWTYSLVLVRAYEDRDSFCQR